MTAWNKHHTELAQNEVSPIDAKGKPSTSSRCPFRPDGEPVLPFRYGWDEVLRRIDVESL